MLGAQYGHGSKYEGSAFASMSLIDCKNPHKKHAKEKTD